MSAETKDKRTSEPSWEEIDRAAALLHDALDAAAPGLHGREHDWIDGAGEAVAAALLAAGWAPPAGPVSAPETRTTGPRVGDRVEVRVTGTVIARHGDAPNLQIELDPDIVVAGDFCLTCDKPGVECESDTHAWRKQVTTFKAPDRAVLLPRDGAR